MKGAQRNQARAHTVAENMRIFFFSMATKSAVHVVSTERLVDVAILMAIVGIISRVTTWASFTVRRRDISRCVGCMRAKLTGRWDEPSEICQDSGGNAQQTGPKPTTAGEQNQVHSDEDTDHFAECHRDRVDLKMISTEGSNIQNDTIEEQNVQCPSVVNGQQIAFLRLTIPNGTPIGLRWFSGTEMGID